MLDTAAQLQAVIDSCREFRSAEAPAAYPHGLALCVMDSVQVTGVNCTGEGNEVDRYRAYRREQGGDPARRCASFVGYVRRGEGPNEWAHRIGTRNRTSTRSGVFKAEAIRDAAAALAQEIDTTAALLDVNDNDIRPARVGAL